MPNDRDYGSQKEQDNRPDRANKRGGDDDDRTQRDPNKEREGERDLGSSDRGVERSDWNYSKPGTTKEEKKSTDDFDADDDM